MGTDVFSRFLKGNLKAGDRFASVLIKLGTLKDRERLPVFSDAARPYEGLYLGF